MLYECFLMFNFNMMEQSSGKFTVCKFIYRMSLVVFKLLWKKGEGDGWYN